MKKFYSLAFSIFTAALLSAQLVVQVTSPGVVKLTYGANNDYSIYSPGFETPTFWVHVWSPANSNSTGTLYEDAWSNSNVTMNWDAAASAYVGTINLSIKAFTNGNKVFPTGTSITNLGFVFKNQQNGATNQSADLMAANFGFTPTTLSSLATADGMTTKKSTVINGKLYTSHKGSIEITVYEMSGKLVHTIKTSANGNAIDLNVSKHGIYLVKITGKTTEIVKFAR